jgi:hypothetical protein
MMALYVCGPMTGLPELNFPAFFEAERQLLDVGYTVLNPAARAGKTEGQAWEWYLRRGIQDVTNSGGIALLPDWQKSKGARLEVIVADTLGIPKAPIGGWLAAARRSQ